VNWTLLIIFGFMAWAGVMLLALAVFIGIKRTPVPKIQKEFDKWGW
jgi:hypothetical protein